MKVTEGVASITTNKYRIEKPAFFLFVHSNTNFVLLLLLPLQSRHQAKNSIKQSFDLSGVMTG